MAKFVEIEGGSQSAIPGNRPALGPIVFLIYNAADYNTLEGLNNQKVWYKDYRNGLKWVRIEGRGSDPESCTDINIRMSPGNSDTLFDEPAGYHPDYGEITYNDYPENMYVQSERLRQLENIGCVEGENNFIELID